MNDSVRTGNEQCQPGCLRLRLNISPRLGVCVIHIDLSSPMKAMEICHARVNILRSEKQ